MKKLLILLALSLASTTFAGPGPTSSTVQGVGNSTSQSFSINASVGDACTLSIPADITILMPLYWTQAAPFVTGSTSVTVKCNVGAPFIVDASQPVSLVNTFQSGAPLVTDLRIAPASIVDTASIVASAFIVDTASSPAGQLWNITVDVQRPTQDSYAGLYSGISTVTLSLVAN